MPPVVATEAPQLEQCKVVSDQQWSLGSFMEFYDRVLGPRVFKPYGELLVQEIRKDLNLGTTPPSGSSETGAAQQVSGLRILEVASGTGLITAHLYEDLAKPLGMQLVATDLSRITLDIAKTVLSEELQRDVEFRADVDMADLPFEDDSFDILVCGFGLMFPADKARVAREFKRVLRPGGRVYGTVFQSNELFDLTHRESGKHFGTPSAVMNAAMSLTDPTPITAPFSLEGLRPNTTLCPLSFHLDDSLAREFIFNACILLEEFNQCDTAAREAYLDAMLEAFLQQVPDRNYRVGAWLLRGLVGEKTNEGDDEETVALKQRKANFAELSAFLGVSFGSQKALPADGAVRAFEAEKADFLAANPSFPFDEVEAMRRTEFSRLDASGVTYLDHVGGSLAPEKSLLDASNDFLKRTVLGNPHSGGEVSHEIYEKARAEIYRFFHCAPEEYEIIFTANASAAIRLVAESFPFEQGSQAVLSKDNHTSVHGLREFAKAKGASVKYVTLDRDLRIHEDLMRRTLERLPPNKPHLVAFPAQSNATGAKQSLEWIKEARAHGAMVLCDVAAHAPQSRLDCSEHQPDFVSVSFYKIFGHPTGSGCLIARRETLRKLAPLSFSGGAVCYYSGPWSPTDRLLFRADGQRFEIGTPNYAAYPAITLGFQFIERMGIEQLSARSCALARWLEARLLSLRHTVKSQNQLCRVYGPTSPGLKGATVMLNFFDCHNAVISHANVRRAADPFGITIRNGCFCNLGAVQQATYITAGAEHCELDKTEQILDCKSFDEKFLSKGDCGAVRLSFGLGSNLADAYRFFLFAKAFLDIEARAMQPAQSL